MRGKSCQPCFEIIPYKISIFNWGKFKKKQNGFDYGRHEDSEGCRHPG